MMANKPEAPERECSLVGRIGFCGVWDAKRTGEPHRSSNAEHMHYISMILILSLKTQPAIRSYLQLSVWPINLGSASCASVSWTFLVPCENVSGYIISVVKCGAWCQSQLCWRAENARKNVAGCLCHCAAGGFKFIKRVFYFCVVFCVRTHFIGT